MLNSKTFWGGNEGLLLEGLKARIDGTAGTALLVLGFLFQILGSNGVRSPASPSAALVGLLFVLVVLYVAWFRRACIARQKLLAKREEEAWEEGN